MRRRTWILLPNTDNVLEYCHVYSTDELPKSIPFKYWKLKVIHKENSTCFPAIEKWVIQFTSEIHTNIPFKNVNEKHICVKQAVSMGLWWLGYLGGTWLVEVSGLSVGDDVCWRQNSRNSLMINLLLFTFPCSNGSSCDSTENILTSQNVLITLRTTTYNIHENPPKTTQHSLSCSTLECQLLYCLKTHYLTIHTCILICWQIFLILLFIQDVNYCHSSQTGCLLWCKINYRSVLADKWPFLILSANNKIKADIL